MRKLSIKLKITLWFSAVLIIIVGLSIITQNAIGSLVLQKSIKDNLIEMVESNIDEVEYFKKKSNIQMDNDADLYISYNNGYLEIDDDFLDSVNGIYTSLYKKDRLLYGENPIAKDIADLKFEDSKLTTVKIDGINYYVYDRGLPTKDLNNLYLRGIVSEEQGTSKILEVIRYSMFLYPVLLLLSLIGGYLLARRFLKPINHIRKTAEDIQAGKDLKRRIALGIGNDELHELANTFDLMFDRLEKAFESEKQLTSDISHELRTPVSVILAQCELALDGGYTMEEVMEALELINRQGTKMSMLINRLLDFTRLEQSANQTTLTEINLSAVVQSIYDDMSLIKDKGISLNGSIEPDLRILGNAELLTRLTTNLIENAFKYGKQDGHIDLRLCSLPDDKVQLEISDDGIGIAPENVDRIWDRFYQVDPSRSSSGSGLGLSMVKQICDIHHAQITVNSELEKGTKFLIIF